MHLLKPGDRIYIVAPSRKIRPEEVRETVNLLNREGFEVILGKHLFDSDNQYAGTDASRTADLQTALDDVKTKAILCARGGYGCLRIVDALDFSAFSRHQKWLCGYSDITVLHAHINHVLNMPSLHSTMAVNITAENAAQSAIETMLTVLRTGEISYQIPTQDFNVTGDAKGKICGGNLSILHAINGSVSDIDARGKILFIEDLDEYLYHIDRMMLTLKRSGKLSHLAGLIVGGMSNMHDNPTPFGKTVKGIVKEHVKDYDYPVCFDFPAGHIPDNRALILGAEAHLTIDKNSVTLKMKTR